MEQKHIGMHYSLRACSRNPSRILTVKTFWKMSLKCFKNHYTTLLFKGAISCRIKSEKWDMGEIRWFFEVFPWHDSVPCSSPMGPVVCNIHVKSHSKFKYEVPKGVTIVKITWSCQLLKVIWTMLTHLLPPQIDNFRLDFYKLQAHGSWTWYTACVLVKIMLLKNRDCKVVWFHP